MADTIGLEVQGLSDFERQLEKLGNAFAGNVLYGALFDACKPIMDASKANAPEGAGEYYRYYKGKKDKATGKRNKSRILMQHGLLKKSITRSRVRKLDKPAATVRVKNKAFWWRFIEHGTPTQAARPFLRPAFDASKEQALERFKVNLRKRIDKIAAKNNIDLSEPTDNDGDEVE